MTYSPIPKWTITDTNGEPVVAGTLYFYEAGTTTPKNVYSDAARTISAGAELTTDSLGQVGPVYLDTAAATKVVCKDSADVTLWTVDNLTAPSGTSVTVTSVPRSVSPLDYGAVGDGAADESTEVQQALDAAAGFVDLGGKTYRCDSGLTLPAGTRLINGTLDFSQMGSGTACLSATGSLGSPIFATADIDGGDETITLSSTAGLTSGKWVKVSSNATWGAVGSTKDGELCRIFSVFSGTSLWMDGRLIDGYTVANSAKVEQLTTVADIAIEDVRITGTTLISIPVISLTYCERASIRNVRISSYAFSAISLISCVECSVDACSIADSTAGTGIVVDGTSHRITVTNTKLSETLIGISIGRASDGVCRFVSVAQCSMACGASTGSTGVKFDQDSQFCSVDGSFIQGGFSTSGAVNGVIDYGNANRVTNCDIVSAEAACIHSETRVSKATSFNATSVNPAFAYIGNTMQSLDDGIVVAPYTGVALNGGLIADNRIQYAAANAVELQSVAAISNLRITGNVIGQAYRAFYMYGASAFDSIVFNDNTVKIAEALAIIDIDASSSGVYICRNKYTRTGTNFEAMVDVDLATAVNLSGLHIDQNDLRTGAALFCDHAVRITSADAGRLTDFSVDMNTIDMETQSLEEPVIELTDVRGGRVCGNIISGDAVDYGIVLQSLSATVVATVADLLIADNKISMSGVGATGATPGGNKSIFVYAAGSSDIEDVSVIDNILQCGSSSLRCAVGVYAITGQVVDRITIKGNVVYCSASSTDGFIIEGVDADSILRATIAGNSVDTFGTALSMDKCKYGIVSGNHMQTRNTVPDITLVVDDCEAISVASNTLVNTRTAAGSNVVGVTGTAVTEILFSGNLLLGGNISMDESATATTALAAIGNLFGGGASSYFSSSGGGWDLGVASTTNTDFKNGY